MVLSFQVGFIERNPPMKEQLSSLLLKLNMTISSVNSCNTVLDHLLMDSYSIDDRQVLTLVSSALHFADSQLAEISEELDLLIHSS